MIQDLVKLIKDQNDKLKELLLLLQTQYEMIAKKDLFGLEGLVDKINDCSKEIAKVELERRNMMGDINLTKFVQQSNNEELSKHYEEIIQTTNDIKVRKETNEIMLKQKMSFNAKMLAILNPSRDIKTYNSYGNIRK